MFRPKPQKINPDSKNTGSGSKLIIKQPLISLNIINPDPDDQTKTGDDPSEKLDPDPIIISKSGSWACMAYDLFTAKDIHLRCNLGLKITKECKNYLE